MSFVVIILIYYYGTDFQRENYFMQNESINKSVRVLLVYNTEFNFLNIDVTTI